jgi:hypothetical protein
VVVVRRYGDGVFPVATRVTFTDGSKIDQPWDGRDRWRAFRMSHAARIATVAVDPDRILLLDVRHTTNSWTATPRAEDASKKWAMRWLTWVQELLLTYAFFA